MNQGLLNFVTESNGIEGIHRTPTVQEIDAHTTLLELFEMNPDALHIFQSVVAPGKPLRDRIGLDVQVGGYVAPRGGPATPAALAALCDKANRVATEDGVWRYHVEFELLHPYMDGNGRTGRALWAWMMVATGRDPFALSFLHRFYYQTLASAR